MTDDESSSEGTAQTSDVRPGKQRMEWDQSPFGSDYEDPRTPEARLKDKDAVVRQARALEQGRDQRAFSAEILKAIQARRAQRDDLVQLEFVPDVGEDVPVARGELLVRTKVADDPRIWATLEQFGFQAEKVDCLDGRLVRLRNVDIPAQRLNDIARVVRAAGHQASVDHITPLRPLIKGEGGPERTDGRRKYPPEFARTVQVQQQDVRVAVIDTGITAEPRGDGWLAGLVRADDDPLGGNADPLDAIPTVDGFLDFAAGHGSFVAGVVQQVAPFAQLSIWRALDSDGVGRELDVACAIVQAAEDGAGVINLSLGAETLDDQPLLAVEVALEILRERHPDTLVVAAAGNTGSTRPCFPAAQRPVVAVGALTDAMTPASWATRGFWVDFSTVGQGVFSTYVRGQESAQLDPEPEAWTEPDPWAVWSGSSFAAPQIAGAVARLCAQTAGLTPRQALAQLHARARPVPDFGRAVRILPGT